MNRLSVSVLGVAVLLLCLPVSLEAFSSCHSHSHSQARRYSGWGVATRKHRHKESSSSSSCCCCCCCLPSSWNYAARRKPTGKCQRMGHFHHTKAVSLFQHDHESNHVDTLPGRRNKANNNGRLGKVVSFRPIIVLSMLVTVLVVACKAKPSWAATTSEGCWKRALSSLHPTATVTAPSTSTSATAATTTAAATAAANMALGWIQMAKALALFIALGPLLLTVQQQGHGNTSTNTMIALVRRLLVAALRCFGQLTLVAGPVLVVLLRESTPIALIAAWMLWTTAVAAWEAHQRLSTDSPHYAGLSWHLATSLGLAVTTVLGSAAAWNLLGTTAVTTTHAITTTTAATTTSTTTAVATTNWPRTYIPVLGMLLGNAVTAVSLAARTFVHGLVGANRATIEASLVRGATWREATAALRRQTWQAALTPTLNSLQVTGIVHIPGLMTGQLLAGVAPLPAAAQQVVLLLLLGTTACTATQLLVPCMARALVDTRNDCLRPESVLITTSSSSSSSSSASLAKANKRSLATSLKYWLQTRCKAWRRGYKEKSAMERLLKGEGVTLDGTQTFIRWKDYRPVSSSSSSSSSSAGGAARGTATTAVPYPVLDVRNLRVKRANNIELNLQLYAGDRIGIRGPSGIGKTQILRSLVGLEGGSNRQSSFRLYGLGDWDMPSWRQRVALVPQTDPPRDGTPMDFLHQVTSFRSQQVASQVLLSPNNQKNDTATHDRRPQKDRANQMFANVSELAAEWGIPATMFHRTWSTLSGGQCQRILLAVAAGLKPDVLLLDESTSAMDELTTLRVEDSLRQLGIPLVLVSHSNEQLERFCDQIIDLVPAGPFTTAQWPGDNGYGVFE